jgi:hypothetical protein
MASTNFNRNAPVPNRIRTNGGAAAHAIHPVETEDETAVSPPELMAPPAGQNSGTSGIVEVINSAELAKRLGVPESWVRSRSNLKRTDDPIPHYKFGRYVQFPWGSDVLRAWLNRQLVSTDRAGHSRRNE